MNVSLEKRNRKLKSRPNFSCSVLGEHDESSRMAVSTWMCALSFGRCRMSKFGLLVYLDFYRILRRTLRRRSRRRRGRGARSCRAGPRWYRWAARARRWPVSARALVVALGGAAFGTRRRAPGGARGVGVGARSGRPGACGGDVAALVRAAGRGARRSVGVAAARARR